MESIVPRGVAEGRRLLASCTREVWSKVEKTEESKGKKGLTRSDFWIYKRPLAGGGILDACKPVLTLSSAPRAHANAISPPTCMYTKAVEEADMPT